MNTLILTFVLYSMPGYVVLHKADTPQQCETLAKQLNTVENKYSCNVLLEYVK